MFEAGIYKARRSALLAKMSGKNAHGLAIFLGNAEAPQNYRGNDYKFRQDASFLYFWGIDEPLYAAILDLDTAQATVYADDVEIDDIIWMGPQPSVASKALLVGTEASAPYKDFMNAVKDSKAKGREIHFLPPSRYYNAMTLAALTGGDPEAIRKVAPVNSSNVPNNPIDFYETGGRTVCLRFSAFCEKRVSASCRRV